MPTIKTTKRILQPRNRRLHLANERTFLAWVRTSIAIMAFGFVVERFSLFVKQLTLLVGRTDAALGIPSATPVHPSHGYASLFGIVLVGLGALIAVAAFIRYRKVQQQITTDAYRPSFSLDLILSLFVLAIGVFLALYLVYTT
jgi:putative membrane protein